MNTDGLRLSRIGAVCRDCAERSEGCHGRCEKYITAKDAWIEEKRKINEVKHKDREYNSHHYKRVAKSMKARDKK